ncbi:MAG: hypothetical protein DHS20C21_03350 [Gemmatimonadota bacterium]|nr:MAG: hypothetical protein DHS20C21_03350 [Gemmatimonadota bacterium]
MLPTPLMRKRLLETLHNLARELDLCSEAEWERMVSTMSSQQLRWKHSLPAADDGPHGFLTREVILDPGELPIFDYTYAPEYLQNLCSAFPQDVGTTLLAAYRDRTSRAIVKFRSSEHLAGVIPCAVTYARVRLSGQPLREGCSHGFSGSGTPIPSEDVIGIEWLQESTA